MYVWLFYNTEKSLLSFIIAYLVLAGLQLLNVYSVLVLFQKLLGIALLDYIFSLKLYVGLFVTAVIVGNFFFLGNIWSKNAEVKDLGNRAFAYIFISLMLGILAYILRN